MNETDAESIAGSMIAIALAAVALTGIVVFLALTVGAPLRRIADALERAHPPAATEEGR